MKNHLMCKPAARSQSIQLLISFAGLLFLSTNQQSFPIVIMKKLVQPLRETNLLMAAIHAAVLRSDTTSR